VKDRRKGGQRVGNKVKSYESCARAPWEKEKILKNYTGINRGNVESNVRGRSLLGRQ